MADLKILHTQVFETPPKTTLNNGTVSGTGVTAEEFGDGNYRRTRLTFVDTPVVLADNAGVVAYGGLKVFTFPEGRIQFQWAACNIAVTKSSAGVNADWDGDFGVGRVTASNNNSLSSTEQDMIPTTPTPQAVAGATTARGMATATEASQSFDGTSTAIPVFVNFLVDDTDHNVNGTACNLILNGYLDIWWLFGGDY